MCVVQYVTAAMNGQKLFNRVQQVQSYLVESETYEATVKVVAV